MKKTTLIASAALLALCGACGSGSEKGTEAKSVQETIEMETYTYKVISETSPDSVASDFPGAQYCLNAGTGVLPVKIGSRDIKALRDTLIALANIEFPSSGTAAPKLAPGWKATNLPDTTQSCGEAINMLSVVLNTPYIIVWQNYMGEYPCGAAHGMYANSYINYSLTAGKVITLADIMKPGYEEKLKELLRNRLAENSEVTVARTEIEIPSQFRVTFDGISFIYGIYEIAPYSAGEIEASFSFDELSEVLTDKGLDLVAGPPF